ncbi:MAG: Npt1/Npt2 family nucleotide transporter [Polyangiaceae bacterium]
MLRRLFPVRRSERRDAITAFVFLFVFVAGHSILEATRDAMFLAHIPTSRLPWVYVALAAATLVATRAQAVFRRTTPRRVLIGWTVASSLGTIALSRALPSLGEVGLYVFYIWSGVLSTIVLIHFWSLVGGLFSIRQAKRLYGMIGLGAGLGAILGSGAVGLVTWVAPANLSLFAGVLFFGAAWMPMLFSSGGLDERARDGEHDGRDGTLGERLGTALRHPYIRRVVAVCGLITIAVTISDFIFKSQITAHFAHDQLARVFGRVNVVLNVISVCVQVFAVRSLVARLPLPLVFAVLPFGLVAGGLGVAITGTLAPAVITKAVDGSMRFSVHRTAAELLLVPLEDGPRTVAKSFMDALGQRGAQMVGSVVILVGVATELPPRWLAVLLVVTAAGAVVLATWLRGDYAQLFKDALASGRRRLAGALMRLDMASLESLLESLESEAESTVVSSLRILDREGKAHVIPGLILYHPSETVVVTALRIFGVRGRKVALHALTHLDRHPSIRVRAEAMAARAVLAPDATRWREQLARETSPDIRAAILTTMAAFSMMEAEEAHHELGRIVSEGSVESRRLLAEVVGWRKATRFEPEIVELTRARELDVRRAAIAALGGLATETSANTLVDLLADSQVGADVRLALSAAGPAGAGAIVRALRDRDRPRAVRRLVPSLFADIDSPEAPEILLANLGQEPDGMVRYRSILALGQIVVARPETRLDERLLGEEIQRTVARAYRSFDRFVALRRGREEDPRRATVGHGLLVDLLRDKQRHMVGRVFRLLALLNPNEEIDAIFTSIERGGKEHRATAVELIHIVLKNPLRDAVIGLVDDVDDVERRTRGKEFHASVDLDYETAIAQMLGSSSAILRKFAAYHAAELGMTSQLPRIEELCREEPDVTDFSRARALLAGAPDRAAEPEAPEVTRRASIPSSTSLFPSAPRDTPHAS